MSLDALDALKLQFFITTCALLVISWILGSHIKRLQRRVLALETNTCPECGCEPSDWLPGVPICDPRTPCECTNKWHALHQEPYRKPCDAHGYVYCRLCGVK